MNKPLSFSIEQTALALEETEKNFELPTSSYRGLSRDIEAATDLLIESLFPGYASRSTTRVSALAEAVGLMEICLKQVLAPERDPRCILSSLLESLPEVRRQLQTDLEAAYRGDPAAISIDEVILCYPAFLAISAYRLAHILYMEKVPLLPRLMTEYAHRLTGIDIHPGATIGDSFFIDHGTGVVIGETTTIGENVKLYQHVTLGAKSFEVAEDGTLVKGIKRHPDIGDRVVVYSGATILGGSTQIGNDCVIGGSVWLTHSVEAGKMVLSRSVVMDTPLTKDLLPSPTDSAML